MKKKILIIGANSALAKVSQKLLSCEYEIITAGRHDCDLNIDITKEFTIPAEINTVINFACFSGDDVSLALNTNVIGTLNICKASLNAKQLILISSTYVQLDETSPYYSIYAITKRQAEEIAKYYCLKNNIPLLVLRPTQLYGYTDDFANSQPLFYTIKNNAKNGLNTVLFGQNTGNKNFICANDIAKIIKLCIDKHITGFYNCVFEKDTSILEIAETAYKVFNNGGEIIFDKTKPDIPDNIFNYDDTLYKKIGYYPNTTIEQIFNEIKGQKL